MDDSIEDLASGRLLAPSCAILSLILRILSFLTQLLAHFCSSQLNLGPSWGHPGLILGFPGGHSLQKTFICISCLMYLTLSLLRYNFRMLGHLGVFLGSIWGHLGAILGPLGAILGPFGASLGPLGTLLGLLGATLDPPGGLLWPPWGERERERERETEREREAERQRY